MDLKELIKIDPVIADLAEAKEVCWINPKKIPFAEAKDKLVFGPEDIAEASARLQRFAPLLAKIFPETAEQGGIIESPLTEIPAMKALLKEKYGADLGTGRLFLKRDSDLAVAGSVKARGGFHDVLKHTEDLALEAGIFSSREDDPMKLLQPEAIAFFKKHKVQVASTGNLGVSIGMMSAHLGYQAIVHMSADAKQWKKDYLRAHGVTVIEYAGDYGKAITEGRAISDADPDSYFVDDENSKELFMGYAVAAERLQKQLADEGVTVDEAHPLFVTIPCGVGGAPGGVAFGLKQIYGDNVHVMFAEPVQACCMVLGMATGLHNQICVQDIGLSGKTHADGLAVGRASSLVGKIMEPLL
ncbi:MAG: D-serine ammonia-lyase, partial [Firmicutes bacterium]|nr:D-serine ammonia-lyase [Bacillota bacterium]